MKSSFGKSFGLFVSLLFLILFIKSSKSASFNYKTNPFDSIRSENINGQRVIVYSVSPHETLYSIARRYNINPKTLISFNHNIKTLSTGQEILIPRGSSSISLSPTRSNGYVSSTTVTVKKGETLYSIAHSHGFTAEEIQKANQLYNFSLKLGQKLFIPAFNPEISSNKTANNPIISTDNSTNKKIEKPNSSLLPMPASGLYTVGSGETIYSIGFKYGVGVEEIRSLNNIVNNDIKVGQTLRLRSNVAIPENTAVANPISNSNPGISTPSPEKRNSVTLPPDISKPETLSNNRPFLPASEPHRSRNIPRAFKEEGMGIWIDNTDLNQAKSVALHRLAPVGTVIKVTNPMTKKSIFVKVVGSFPETAETKNAVLVISKSAALLIGAIDPHFRVELSYAY